MSETGKRVLITAAADGLGRTIAEAFLERGDTVALCDIAADKVAAVKAAHPGIMAEVCDVTDERALRAFAEKALDWLGGCDVLVNNAGISGETGPMEELSIDALRQCLEINVVSHFVCLQHVLPVMKAQKSGLIVNLSSAAGLFAYPLRTPYSASKWGVVGVSKSLAAEVAGYGIRVNAICPGPVAGARIDRVIAARAESKGIPVEEEHANYVAMTSLRRLVEPEEIAGMVLYLDSPPGRAISGQALAVDGHIQSLS